MAEGCTIIDTDPGIDDVVALALAARSPELTISGVTTTYGTATLDATTRNARALLDLVGRHDVLVHPGAAQPLERPLATAPEAHGSSGAGYAAVPPTSAVRPNPTVLVDILQEADRPVTLITLGPLTNLAHALLQDSHIVRRRLARHIGVFGSIDERSAANRWADFNAWCDPEAAACVLDAALPTVMVPLDVTRRMVLSASEVARFVASRDPLVAWLGKALEFYVESFRSRYGVDGCAVNDVLPIGELLVPGLLTLAEHRIGIDLVGGEHRGRTRRHPRGRGTVVAVAADILRMRQLLRRVFGDALE
ncbi:MAG: nucleoside hydrolase [Gemmatimonadales bacterium]|nr:nucleoside hydrolase [Gemmatimonadales bacterium]NIN12901.1 nucleoside hydrolase [Gemmatimonadales bacterium]NIR00188.1 nucleoside hydrolase [Gemmatimonadales bacterium]NIS65981.1 nucleoside hydrolase [Gemmatimonadales bacterium]